MIALTNATTITISVAGVVVILGLLALLRAVMRKEPAPPSWRRFRLGVFVERDPRRDEVGGDDP